MLGRHILYWRFKLPRYHFGSKLEDRQRYSRRESIKQLVTDEYLDSGHQCRPRIFNRSLIFLMTPSLFYMGGIIDPFYSLSHVQSLSVLYENLILYSSTTAGYIYYFSVVSKPQETLLKQVTIEGISTTIPFIIFGASCTIFHFSQSVVSFAILYPGLTLLIYGAQNIQTYRGVPANLFRFMAFSGIFAFIASIFILLIRMSQLNEQKSIELKLEELQRLSDVMRRQ